MWLTTEDERRLVQLQDDLLIANWRRRGDEGYPRFEGIVDEFTAVQKTWLSVLDTAKLEAPVPTVFEVTYINWVDDMPVADFFAPAAALSSPDVSAATESFGYRANYPIEVDGRRTGRFSVECGSAVRQIGDADPQPGTGMVLSAKIRADESQTTESIFNIGRCAIVRAFADLTTQEAHERWGRVS